MPRSFYDRETGQPVGFICGPGLASCSACDALALHLCDYPMGKGKTCDAPLCCNHAIAVRPVPQNRVRIADVGEDAESEWVESCPQHAAVHGLRT